MLYPIVIPQLVDGVVLVPAQGALVHTATGKITAGWCYPGQVVCEIPTLPDPTEYDCIDMTGETVESVQAILSSQHTLTLMQTEEGWEREEEEEDV